MGAQPHALAMTGLDRVDHCATWCSHTPALPLHCTPHHTVVTTLTPPTCVHITQTHTPPDHQDHPRRLQPAAAQPQPRAAWPHRQPAGAGRAQAAQHQRGAGGAAAARTHRALPGPDAAGEKQCAPAGWCVLGATGCWCVLAVSCGSCCWRRHCCTHALRASWTRLCGGE